MRSMLIFGAALSLAALSAVAQVPPVTGHCVANCGNGGAPEPREPREHPTPPLPPSPAEIERQEFDQAMRDYQAQVAGLNRFVAAALGGLDPQLRDSVMRIFGADRESLRARGDVVPSTSFSAPSYLGVNFPALEAELRGLLVTMPGLRSAGLYRADIAALDRRTAGAERDRAELASLRASLQQWLAAHPGLDAAAYRSRVDALAAEIEALDRRNAAAFQEARSLAKSATEEEKRVLARLAVPAPESLGRDGPEIAAADDYAQARAPLVPATAALAERARGAFPRGLRAMPDWSRVAPGLAPWYPAYAAHIWGTEQGRSGGITALADPVPQPPPAIFKAAVAPLSPGEARARLQPELRELSQDLGQLNDAVHDYGIRHKRYLAAAAARIDAGNALIATAEPAFRALHVEALEVLGAASRHSLARTAWLRLYESVRSVAWANAANLAAKYAPTEPREKAMIQAVKLIPAVQDLAKHELDEISKGPEVLALGDPADAAELEAQIQQHVCGFIASQTWPMQNLPNFLSPYMTEKSCAAAR